MKHGSTVIAFIEDPDGYKIELIQMGTQGSAKRQETALDSQQLVQPL